MPDNFFAMLTDGNIRRIALLPNIEPAVRNIFTSSGPALLENREEVEFNGSYNIEVDEILYVTIDLPAEFADVANNPMGIPMLDLQNDAIKALFWYEDEQYYWQNFDNRKMLYHKTVLFYDNQTFNRLTKEAFVLDNTVNAAYRDGKFYFISYTNANKIFSLLAFYKEATNEDLAEFADHGNVSISDPQWFIDNSNTVIRKHVTLLKKSNILDIANTRQIRRGARKFRVPLELDKDGKIIFPQNRAACKDILYFLNEQLYEGPISKKQYKTNSKKQINKEI